MPWLSRPERIRNGERSGGMGGGRRAEGGRGGGVWLSNS